MAMTSTELQYRVTNESGRLEVKIPMQSMTDEMYLTEEDLKEMLEAIRRRKSPAKHNRN